MNKSILTIACAAIALTGCISTAHQNGQTLDTFASGKPLPMTWAAASATSGKDVSAWVASYNDVALNDLIGEAFANNANLQSVSTIVDRARALSRKSNAALLPRIDGVAGAVQSGGFETGASTTSSYDLQFIASWESDLWGRISDNSRAAEFGVAAAQADYEAAQHVLAAAVAEAYFTALEARQQTRVAEDTLDALTQTLSFIEVQYERGLRSGQDISLIRADVESTRERVITSRGAQRDALRAIEILIGRYPNAQLLLKDTFPRLPSLQNNGIPADLLNRRPDLRAAQARVASARHSVSAAKAARYPNLSLSGVVSVGTSDGTALFDPASLAWRAATGLTAPLFDGGAIKADIDAEEAELARSIASYQNIALSAFGDVERQLDSGRVLQDRETSISDALAQARQALQYTQYRYENGDGDLLDVLSIQQRVSSLESASVSLKRARLVQHAALAKALGTNPLLGSAG